MTLYNAGFICLLHVSHEKYLKLTTANDSAEVLIDKLLLFVDKDNCLFSIKYVASTTCTYCGSEIRNIW